MKRISSLSVVARLTLVFGALSLLTLVNVGLLYWQQARNSSTIDGLVQQDLGRMRMIDQWGALARETSVRVMAVNKSGDPSLGDLFNPEIGPRLQQVGQMYEQLQATAQSEQERAWFQSMEPKRQALLKAIGDVAEYKKIGDIAGASAMFDSAFMPAVKAYLAEIDVLEKIESDLLADKVQQLRDSAQRRSMVVTAAAAALGAIILLFAANITRYIKRSLQLAVGLARSVADGDLKNRTVYRGNDEFSALMCSLNDMSDALQRIVTSVRDSTDNIALASAEIAQGNQHLSERTESQAAEVQQTASSVDQLSVMVSDNADHAGTATTLAVEARQAAEQGGDIVADVVSTMSGINAASKKISEIIGVIDGIAFQTNILALNAAVEAARAGEQGRGFAVVAGEVRSLAGRSAEAAREIKALISDSAQRVEQGAGLVDQAGSAMSDVVNRIRRVSDLMTDIHSASSSQRSEVAQVGEVMRRIDQSTQQNAAMVEQVSAAAASLEMQAQRLVEAVSVFQIDAVPATALALPSSPQRVALPA